MKKNSYRIHGLRASILVLVCILTASFSHSQVSVTCPSNIVVGTDSNSCSAVVTYDPPSVISDSAISTTFSFTGAQQTYVVPANVSEVFIEAWGAQGMGNSHSTTVDGGLGGYAYGTLAVSPGDTLYVFVGDGGYASTTGGWNGGGNAGTVGCGTAFGGGGGGASDVRVGDTTFASRIIIAGGGGGAGGNRVATCGRGTGGGGGGGYYGGGGGAAWPFGSTTLPTGGSQSAGGTGGTSTYTSAPNNNGTAGSLGQGGTGGDEVSSSQSSNATALPGGAGGDTLGGDGQYSNNWTGQSGAGGSGYVGGVNNDSMATGVWTGAGQVRIGYFTNFTLTQTAGDSSGATYSGITTQAFTVTNGTFSDSCSFTITVNDSTAPAIASCPAIDSIFADSSCSATVPDYSTVLSASDNCDASPTISQDNAAGTIVSGVGSTITMAITVTDSSGNADSSCTFTAVVIDNTAPTWVCDTTTQVFTPNTLNCNLVVSFNEPTGAADNCSLASTSSSHMPGDTFPVGATTVTYSATDSSGNVGECSFVVMVNDPVLDGVIMQMPGVICDGQSGMLDAGPGYSAYNWSTGGTQPMITVNASGVYWVDVTDSSGCTGRDSFTVTLAPLPNPTIGSPGGDTLCIPNIYSSYQWFSNMNPLPMATMPCFVPMMNGTFHVVVTDSNGCQGSSDTITFVNRTEALLDNGLEVYPNPTQGEFNLRVGEPINEEGAVSIYDITGKLILQTRFDQLNGTMTMDLQGVDAGVYLLEVRSEHFLSKKRLVKTE